MPVSRIINVALVIDRRCTQLVLSAEWKRTNEYPTGSDTKILCRFWLLQWHERLLVLVYCLNQKRNLCQQKSKTVGHQVMRHKISWAEPSFTVNSVEQRIFNSERADTSLNPVQQQKWTKLRLSTRSAHTESKFCRMRRKKPSQCRVFIHIGRRALCNNQTTRRVLESLV